MGYCDCENCLARAAARESEANALRKALRMAEEHNALLLKERDEARAELVLLRRHAEHWHRVATSLCGTTRLK